MTTMDVEQLTFSFPAGWAVTQYDEWRFYRNRFQSCCTSSKGVDLLAFDPSTRTVWLLEIKDFRRHERRNPLPLWDDIAQKVRDTLAGLVATRFNGDDPGERDHANRALRAQRLRVVFHLEQPQKHSKLFPRAFDPADVQQKLRQQLRPIDARALVVDKDHLTKVDWTVT